VLLLVALAGCRRSAPEQVVQAPAAVAEKESGEKKEKKEKTSDLDRSLEALFGERCEHGRRTFECAACRAEVGVARLQAKLVEGGLVKLARASKQRASSQLALTGEVRFDERRIVHLSPQVDGVIRAVHVALGQRVARGQALLELESVELGQAQADYLEARAALKLAQKTYERQKQLHDERITSEKELLQAQQRHEAASIRVRSSQEKLQRLGMAGVAALAEEGAARARGRLVLRAPLAGSVLEMHAVPGEMAKAGKSLLLVGDVSTVWVWADLYEADLARVTELKARGLVGAAIEVRGFPGETFPGTVELLGTTMDAATRTVKVRVDVKNPEAKLRPGMFASVRLQVPGGGEVVVVPAAALQEDEGRSFVFVHHHDDYYVRRAVLVGRRWGQVVEVTRGLAGGERVVGEGSFLLKSDVLRSKMGAGCAD